MTTAKRPGSKKKVPARTKRPVAPPKSGPVKGKARRTTKAKPAPASAAKSSRTTSLPAFPRAAARARTLSTAHVSSTPPAAPAEPPAIASSLSAAFPQVPAGKVLSTIGALSTVVNVEMRESDLARLVYDTLTELLPGRWVAVRTFNPKTLITTAILADAPLIDAASDMPIAVERAVADEQVVASGDHKPPSENQASGGVRIELVDKPPLIFRDAVDGFSIPLLAGGEISGEVHVNYPAPKGASRNPATSTFPGLDGVLQQDRGLVVPIANHLAVVAHTRRLLRETSYLRDYQEHLIDQANVLILATDMGGRVTVWNRAMTRLTGFARHEVVGKDLIQWMTELGSPQLSLVMRQVAATSETATRELRLSSVGGAVLRAAFNVAIVKHGNQPAAVLAVGQDVTALRALQSQVMHSEKLATLGQIAAGVAHEINNPLTSIQVCAEAVARKAAMAKEGRVPNAFDDSDLDRLAKIKEGAERIRRFAHDLVSYSRPSGTERQDVDINELATHALSFCEHPLDEHKARLETDFHPNLPPIHMIRDQMMQVLINLINNAAQALPPGGGLVRVRTWKKGNGAVGIAISDTGKGIKDSDRAHIFEPFFSTKAPGRGTGLGLPIVRNIVYSHGGQITFQGRYGGGTTFVLTLPVSKRSEDNPQENASEHETRASNRST